MARYYYGAGVSKLRYQQGTGICEIKGWPGYNYYYSGIANPEEQRANKHNSLPISAGYHVYLY